MRGTHKTSWTPLFLLKDPVSFYTSSISAKFMKIFKIVWLSNLLTLINVIPETRHAQ
jgi:hypothetical protein